MPGEAFLPFVYDLGRRRATGVLRVASSGESLPIREGAAASPELDVLGRRTAAALARVAALDPPAWSFHPGPVAADPRGRSLPLTRWVQEHIERGLDVPLAAQITAGIAGARLCLRPGAALDLAALDATARLLLKALETPRDLRDLAALARAPRFRLLAFLHFLGSVGALTVLRQGAASRSRAASAPALHAS
jgi:hypothetical protein